MSVIGKAVGTAQILVLLKSATKERRDMTNDNLEVYKIRGKSGAKLIKTKFVIYSNSVDLI